MPLIFSAICPEAFDVLRHKNFDLMIVDLQMPDMDGFEFLEKLKEDKNPHPPVIISTGFATIENAVLAVKKGASDFITKPFTIDNLLFVVERTLKINLLSEQARELEILRSIFEMNRSIVPLTEIEELCTRLLDLVFSSLNPDLALIYLYDEENKLYFIRKQKGGCGFVPPETLPAEYADKFKSSEPALSKANENGLVLFEVPLSSKGNIMGIFTLCFMNREPSQQEKRFLSILGTQIGISLENAKLVNRIRESYLGAIHSLINSLEAKDAYTKGHSEQVAYYAALLGKALGFDQDKIESLRNAGYLHDIGKLGIKDEIILKTGKLTDEEFETVKKHPLITMSILMPLKLKKEELEACYYHHERVNGKGYPSGLTREEIPVMSRILAIADAFSAMISERSYRTKMEIPFALEELKKNINTQFDGELVEAFIHMVESQEKQKA